MKTLATFYLLTLITLSQALGAAIKVRSLNELNEAIAKSDTTIIMEPGQYDLKSLKDTKKLQFSGSNNKVSLRGVYVKVTVGFTRRNYIEVTGDNNLIVGGEFEDVYKNGLEKITDFSEYNKDRKNLSFGLGGSAVMDVLGKNNLIQGIKLTVRGSWPYGYGSYYGIGAHSTFGINKRCGIVIKNVGNTIDGAELQMRSFGHGIYMQGEADETTIKNCLVEGVLRKAADLYKEKDPKDLPVRTNYRFPNRTDFKMDSPGSYPIPKDEVFSLCEDGIRMYDIPGSVTVENCTVKKMRGGVRLYLGGPATVKNCNVQHCQYTAYNLPNGGKVFKSTGDFSFSPLSDYRGGRSRTKAEWTILPSPYASGSHNLMDLLGNGHHITLNRSKGTLDTKEKRAIIVTGSGSTIINNTEYTVVLAKGSKRNKVQSFGPVKDEGSANEVTKLKSLKQ